LKLLQRVRRTDFILTMVALLMINVSNDVKYRREQCPKLEKNYK
jgi:hypothetical protein